MKTCYTPSGGLAGDCTSNTSCWLSTFKRAGLSHHHSYYTITETLCYNPNRLTIQIQPSLMLPEFTVYCKITVCHLRHSSGSRSFFLSSNTPDLTHSRFDQLSLRVTCVRKTGVSFCTLLFAVFWTRDIVSSGIRKAWADIFLNLYEIWAQMKTFQLLVWGHCLISVSWPRVWNVFGWKDWDRVWSCVSSTHKP